MIDVINTIKAWLRKYREKIERAWGFTGDQGMGQFINVDYLRGLDVIMTEFPMGPFSEAKVHYLVDLKVPLEYLQLVFNNISSKG